MQIFQSLHHHLSYDHLVFLVLLKICQKTVKRARLTIACLQYCCTNVMLIVGLFHVDF